MRDSGKGRVALPAHALYQLIVRAFESERDPRCRSCHVALPIFRAPREPLAANWHTGVMRACPYRCHLVLGEVQARLWNRYDLLVEEAQRD